MTHDTMNIQMRQFQLVLTILRFSTHFIHSFISNIYIAPLQEKLLRGSPNSSTAKKQPSGEKRIREIRFLERGKAQAVEVPGQGSHDRESTVLPNGGKLLNMGTLSMETSCSCYIYIFEHSSR